MFFTTTEFEIRRRRNQLKDIDQFVRTFGEPDAFITLKDIFSDVYALYRLGKTNRWSSDSSRYRIYFECDNANCIEFDMSDYMQETLRNELVSTLVASDSNADEPLDYYYDCKANVEIHHKGWRPDLNLGVA